MINDEFHDTNSTVSSSTLQRAFIRVDSLLARACLRLDSSKTNPVREHLLDARSIITAIRAEALRLEADAKTQVRPRSVVLEALAMDQRDER